MAFSVHAKANSDGIVEVISRAVLAELMNQCITPQLVTVGRDIDGGVREKGDTIRIIVPASLTVGTKAENAEYSYEGPSDGNVEVALDTHAYTAFRISNPARMFSRSDAVAAYAKNAALALAAQIDTDLLALYASAGATVGSYGTALDAAAMLSLREAFSDNQINKADRFAVLSPKSVTDLLGEAEFTDAAKYGSASPVMTGELGSIYGIRCFEDPRVDVDDLTTDQHHNLAFQRGCIALATADMYLPPDNSGILAAMASVSDEAGNPTGISVRTMLSYDRDEDSWKFSADLIYGVKVLRADGVFELKR